MFIGLFVCCGRAARRQERSFRGRFAVCAAVASLRRAADGGRTAGLTRLPAGDAQPRGQAMVGADSSGYSAPASTLKVVLWLMSLKYTGY